MACYVDDYDCRDEVRARVVDTVVFYRGEPVLIRGVKSQQRDGQERLYLGFVPLPLTGQDEPSWRLIRSRHFDAGGFRLGFANLEDGVAFVERLPRRVGHGPERQGLWSLNVAVTPVVDASVAPLEAGVRDPDRAKKAQDFGNLVRDQAFCDLLKNRFPDWQQAFLEVRRFANEGQGRSSVAFGRDWCLSAASFGPIVLLFRKRRVGYAQSLSAPLFRLGRDFGYLTESLTQTGLPFVTAN